MSLDFLFALLANQLPFAEQSLRAKAALANNTCAVVIQTRVTRISDSTSAAVTRSAFSPEIRL